MQVVYGGGKQCVISKQDRARSVSVKSSYKAKLAVCTGWNRVLEECGRASCPPSGMLMELSLAFSKVLPFDKVCRGDF